MDILKAEKEIATLPNALKDLQTNWLRVIIIGCLKRQYNFHRNSVFNLADQELSSTKFFLVTILYQLQKHTIGSTLRKCFWTIACSNFNLDFIQKPMCVLKVFLMYHLFCWKLHQPGKLRFKSFVIIMHEIIWMLLACLPSSTCGKEYGQRRKKRQEKSLKRLPVLWKVLIQLLFQTSSPSYRFLQQSLLHPVPVRDQYLAFVIWRIIQEAQW